MQNKKHLYHSSKRVASLMLAGLMILTTALTGCGSTTAHALEDDPSTPAASGNVEEPAPAVDANGNELANINVTLENQTDTETALQSGSYSMVGYDYVVLPLFEPGTVDSLYAHEIDVYVNGSSTALTTDQLGYNPAEGTLTINMTAMTVSEVKIVLRAKTDIGEPPVVIETLDKTQSGMIPIFNADTKKALTPEIAFDKLTVGDVFAYETVGKYGTAHKDASDKMWETGASEFVYTSDFNAGITAEDTYWSFIGNIETSLSDMSYTAGKKDDSGFAIELPFPDERKGASQPILIKTSSHKVKVGAPVYFGEKEDWKWNSVEGVGGVEFNYTIPGQGAMPEIIPTLVEVPEPTDSFDWIKEVAGINASGTFKVLALTEDYVILGFAQIDEDESQRGTALIKVGRFVKVSANKTASSDMAGATVDNDCYADLSTAEYTLYEDAAATKAVGTIKADGTDHIGVPRGTYYVKETKAPVGYQLDTEIHTVEIKENTTLEFKDAPMSDSGIYAVQKNVENRENAGETAGDVGALAEILFDVYYFKGTYDSVDALPALETAEEHAVLKTNEKGLLVLDGDHLVDGSWKYVDDEGKLTYPLGTILVKEKQAIDGLLMTVTEDSKPAAVKAATGTVDPQLVKLIENVPSVDDKDAMAEWFHAVRTWATENGQNRLASIAKRGFDSIGNSVIVSENRTQCLALMKAIGKELPPLTDLIKNVPASSDKDAMAEWFIDVEAWATENGQDEIASIAKRGFDSISNSVIVSENRTQCLALIKAFENEHGGSDPEKPNPEQPEPEQPEKPDPEKPDPEQPEKPDPEKPDPEQPEKPDTDGVTSNEKGFLFVVMDTSDKTAAESKAAAIVVAGNSGKQTDDKAVGSYENAVVKGGVSVTKADADLAKSDYQGDAALSGAEFTIYNRSEAPVFYQGKLVEKGGVVDVITTTFDEASESYVAATDAKVLEYGTYEIKETKAPEGYKLSDWSRTFKIREDGQMHYFNQTSKADAADEAGTTISHEWCTNDVIRGGVTVGKTDRETKGYEGLGGASLAGAKFQIINKSKHPVVVGGTTYETDAVVMEITAEETEVDGKTVVIATTGENVLPYGTYDIKETGSGDGYLFDSKSKDQIKTFSIREDGEMADFTDSEDAFHNQVLRGDWYFTKKASDSGKGMPNVAWTVTSVTTGETHVIVTDENGKYQSNQVSHSQKTNANDPNGNGAIAIDEDGNYYVADETKLDPDAGTWFAGLKDAKADTVNDQLRAYPYDTYLVQELASKANEGYNLVSFMVTIDRYTEDHDGDGLLIDLGTVDNQRADIHVSLGYKTGNTMAKEVPAKKDVELTSTITYSGLTAKEKYTIKQEVHAIDADGKDTGVVADKTTELKANAAGQLTTTFTVDTSKLEGYRLVVTTELLQGKKAIAKADDLNNADQSVFVQKSDEPTEPEEPEKPVNQMLDAYTVNADGFTKELYAKADQSIQAAVKVSNLKEGGVYKLESTVYQIDDTGAAKAFSDGTGKAFTSVIENPKAMNMITFKGIDASKLGGRDIVVYHTLYEKVSNEAERAVEEWSVVSELCDAKDKDLGLSVPSISTKLTVKDGKLVDVVTFRNLNKDQKYILNGALHIREDEKTDKGYQAVDKGVVKNSEVTKEFTAASGDGSVDVAFSSEKAAYNGKVVVAFEELYTDAEHKIPAEWADAFKDGAKTGKRLIAEHKDIEDARQTASILNIKSATLTTKDGSHEITEPGKTTLVNVVDYEGAIPGATYNITTTINVKGEKGSKEVVATIKDTFTPEAVSGTLKLTCEVDVTDLNGETLVAFETISRNGNVLVTRKDINDKEQSVTIKGLPDLDTVLVGDKAQATDRHGKSVEQKKAGESLKFTDTVKYENLTPGKEYTLKGEIHLNEKDKDGGKLATGKAVKFTPEKSKGEIEMTFTVTAANAKEGDYVAFEYLYDGDTLVTSHADIKDKDQTVKVSLFDKDAAGTSKDDDDTSKKDESKKEDTNKKDEDKKENVKTGENTFLLTSILGLTMALGGMYLYFKKRGLFPKR